MDYLYSLVTEFLRRYGILILAGILLLVAAIIVKRILRNPFKYPYFIFRFDVSRKRKPEIEEYIDQYLIDHRMTSIVEHKSIIEQWKNECEERIKNSRLIKYRKKQYDSVVDDAHAYRFIMFRNQTRYQQVNYQKYPYTVENETCSVSCNYDYLENRNAELEKIGYETTLKKYHCKEQRKLMTKNLRELIMERDNYTCQKCGKQMPDKVGLQIDHIVPISNGGKSVSSNLQVLCSVCNSRKSNRT